LGKSILEKMEIGKIVFGKNHGKLTHLRNLAPKIIYGQKLVPKSYRPYTILNHVGHVAYQLALPSHSKLHPFFQISFIKKVIVTKCQTQTNLPKLDEEGSIWLQTPTILDQCECHLCQCTIKEVLVQWKDTTPTDSTWEPTTILHQFPHLKP
jgi:hypothetical protein